MRVQHARLIEKGLLETPSGWVSLAFGRFPRGYRRQVWKQESLDPIPTLPYGQAAADHEWVANALVSMPTEVQSVLWEPKWHGLAWTFLSLLNHSPHHDPTHPHTSAVIRSLQASLRASDPEMRARCAQGIRQRTLRAAMARAAGRWSTDAHLATASPKARSIVEVLTHVLAKPETLPQLQARGVPSRRNFAAVLPKIAKRALTRDRMKLLAPYAINLGYGWPVAEIALRETYGVQLQPGVVAFATWVQQYLAQVTGGHA